MERIVLFGGGNHVQYSIDIVEREGRYKIAGIIDSKRDIGSDLYGYKVLGRQEDIASLAEEHSIDGGVITVGDNWSRHIIREDVVKRLPSFKFVNAIHPSVIIGSNVHLGVGVVAMAGCIFNPGALIGDFTFFATGAQVEHDCVISEFASVSAGSVTGGFVKLGRFAAITLGVTVVDCVEIGDNTVVGSGSLVMKSLPPNVLAYGSPARIVRQRQPGERFLN